MKKLPVALLAALALVLALSPAAEAKCSVTCLGNKVKGLANALTKAQKTIAAQEQAIARQGQAIAALGQRVSGQEGAVSAQNAALSQQSTALSTQAERLDSVEGTFECLFEAPLTQYGNPEASEGYVFDTGSEEVDTTAIDFTEEGGGIDAWFVFDACNETDVLEPASLQRRRGIPSSRSLRRLFG